MMWPTICIDNFFNNPKQVLEYSKTLKYTPAEKGNWPGVRSKAIHEIDNDFYTHIATKMIAALYPNEWQDIGWLANSYFQKIDSRWRGPGWVHKDVHQQFSSIIYLSGDTSCGTSLYKENTHETVPLVNNMKTSSNLKPSKMKTAEYKKELEKHNNKFTKTVSFNSEINRCIMFDSYQYHAVDNFNKDDDNERVTIITFFNSIFRHDGKPLNPHAGESSRI